MLKKLLGVFFIATITVLLGRVDAYAVTFDNDGSARENPYGDAGFLCGLFGTPAGCLRLLAGIGTLCPAGLPCARSKGTLPDGLRL